MYYVRGTCIGTCSFLFHIHLYSNWSLFFGKWLVIQSSTLITLFIQVYFLIFSHFTQMFTFPIKNFIFPKTANPLQMFTFTYKQIYYAILLLLLWVWVCFFGYFFIFLLFFNFGGHFSSKLFAKANIFLKSQLKANSHNCILFWLINFKILQKKF